MPKCLKIFSQDNFRTCYTERIYYLNPVINHSFDPEIENYT